MYVEGEEGCSHDKVQHSIVDDGSDKEPLYQSADNQRELKRLTIGKKVGVEMIALVRLWPSRWSVISTKLLKLSPTLSSQERKLSTIAPKRQQGMTRAELDNGQLSVRKMTA